MSLDSGHKLAHYEIVEPVGQGGMGEVYRARDTKLGRQVAIKVLPDSVAESPERLERLEREAKLLASLNHANIAVLHGLEESEGVHYLVMEFVSGETLAERLERGPLNPEDVRAVAQQLIDALEAAHENGVIHRDLKPANVKITEDDTVKVLDFGLAKSFVEPGEDVDSSLSPTRTRDGSEPGVILGTAAYMSPEQARGRPVDKRSDIFSFGAVLFEMLSGKKAFEGEMVSDILASVIKLEPDWSRLPPATPSSLRRLLRLCVEKDPRKRLRDIGDARIVIEAEEAPIPANGRSNRWLWLSLAVGIGVGAVGSTFVSRSDDLRRSSGVTRFEFVLPGGDRINVLNRSVLALSPDGSTLVYGANSRLYSRRLDERTAHPIPETDDARSPFFAPDGNTVGFQVRDELRKIPLDGSPAMTIGRVGTFPIYGAAWTNDEEIVFASRDGLFRVPAAGGTPERVFSVDGDYTVRFPEPIPGGEWVLASFRSSSGGRGSDVGAVSIETGETRTVVRDGRAPRLLPTGELAFIRDNEVMVAPFDAERVEITGETVSVGESVDVHPNTEAAQFQISDSGTLVYVGSEGGELNQMVWVETNGATSTFSSDVGYFNDVRFSPGGERVALNVRGGDSDIWIHGLERGDKTRLTFSPLLDEVPVWSPDGSSIVWSGHTPESRRVIWRRAADGSNDPEALLETDRHVHVSDWLSDGSALIVDIDNADTGWDLYLLPLDGEGTLEVIAESPFEERNARLSPGGKWLAFVSTESEREEVYVRPFPELDSKYTVSTGGGVQPVWSRDGKTLFYRGEQYLMGVTVSDADEFEASAPVPLFEDVFHRPQHENHTSYDVAPDGRFLMLTRHRSDDRYRGLDRFHVVLNWLEEVRERAPTE